MSSDIEIHYADDDNDDIELFSDAVAMILEKGEEKIRLNIYNDGISLLSIIDKVVAPKSVIFLDINMPFKDGIEVLEEVRSNKELDRLPVVMFSTSSEKSIVEECWRKGANLYAIKPSSFTGLIDIIEGIVKIRWEEGKLTIENFIFNS